MCLSDRSSPPLCKKRGGNEGVGAGVCGDYGGGGALAAMSGAN